MLVPYALVCLGLSMPTPPLHRGHSRFFLDTADSNEWKSLLPLGIFHGITTNPVLLQRAGVPCTVESCRSLASQAFALGADEFMLQAWGENTAALIASGLALSEGNRENLVVKVPVTAAGTEAAAALIEAGVRVCLTACYGPHQALVAVSVGAEYLAPYLGRMNDAGKAGHEEIQAMQTVVDGLGGSTRIFAASIRHVDDLMTLASHGVHTFTFSPEVARMLFEIEPLTDAAAADFEQAALAAVPPGWKRFDPEAGADNAELASMPFGRESRWLDSEEGSKRPTPPTPDEMTPGHPALIARAAIAKAYHGERVLTPQDALAMLEAEDEDVDVVDVRTEEQQATHEVNGVCGLTIAGATGVSLDSIVGGSAYLPDSETTVILACSKGPKSLVALDFLYDRFEKIYCIEGGLTAWDAAGLPTERVQDKDMAQDGATDDSAPEEKQ